MLGVFIGPITSSIFFSIYTTLIISLWLKDMFADIMEQYIALVISSEGGFGLLGSYA